VRYAIMVAVVLIGILAAAQLLRFESFTVLMGGLITFLAQVLWGTIVIGVGIFLALLVGRAIRVSSRPSASVLAMMAQVAIMVFAVAMGLRAMGFANQVVIIGFGAIVGAVAVAFAIAFGLGGRDTAGRELDSWIKNLRSGGSSNT